MNGSFFKRLRLLLILWRFRLHLRGRLLLAKASLYWSPFLSVTVSLCLLLLNAYLAHRSLGKEEYWQAAISFAGVVAGVAGLHFGISHAYQVRRFIKIIKKEVEKCQK